jgi:hypothetical protein
LSWFDEKEGQAKKGYRQYVKAGIDQGRRLELVDGSLIRSLGGWSEVLSLRRDKERVLTDMRILGSGDFVEKILRKADETLKSQLSGDKCRQEVVEFVLPLSKIILFLRFHKP